MVPRPYATSLETEWKVQSSQNIGRQKGDFAIAVTGSFEFSICWWHHEAIRGPHVFRPTAHLSQYL